MVEKIGDFLQIVFVALLFYALGIYADWTARNKSPQTDREAQESLMRHQGPGFWNRIVRFYYWIFPPGIASSNTKSSAIMFRLGAGGILLLAILRLFGKA